MGAGYQENDPYSLTFGLGTGKPNMSSPPPRGGSRPALARQSRSALRFLSSAGRGLFKAEQGRPPGRESDSSSLQANLPSGRDPDAATHFAPTLPVCSEATMTGCYVRRGLLASKSPVQRPCGSSKEGARGGVSLWPWIARPGGPIRRPCLRASFFLRLLDSCEGLRLLPFALCIAPVLPRQLFCSQSDSSFIKGKGEARGGKEAQNPRPSRLLNPMKAISERNCEHVLMHMHEKGAAFFFFRETDFTCLCN